MNLVRRDRPTEPLQIELADGSCVDGLFDSPEDALADQDLASLGNGAEPGGEVRDRPEPPARATRPMTVVRSRACGCSSAYA